MTQLSRLHQVDQGSSLQRPLLSVTGPANSTEESATATAQLKDIPLQGIVVNKARRSPSTSAADDDDTGPGGLDDPPAPTASSVASAGPLSLSGQPSSIAAQQQQQQQQDWQNLLRLLEENEKIGHLFRCARVQGLETVDGLLLFGESSLPVLCYPPFVSLIGFHFSRQGTFVRRGRIYADPNDERDP